MSGLRRGIVGATGAALLLLAVSGCALTETPNSQGSDKPGYSTVGPVTEITPEARGDPIVFSGLLDTGESAAVSDWAGQVLVVNFWYAACPPCRVEAPDLESLYTQFKDSGVAFVGVNVRDEASSSLSFADTFGISYPSFLDARDGQIQLAFAGEIAPKAVPTTLVLDREGRIAARIVGQLDRSTLETLIADALAEPQ